MRRITHLIAVLCASVRAFAGEPCSAPSIDDSCPAPEVRFIQQDFEYSRTILNWQEDVTEKPLKILEFGQDGTLCAPGVMISGAFWGNYLQESTNTVNSRFGGLFPILSRFPDERGRIDDTASRWLVSNAAIATTIKPTNWLAFYSQLEYTEVEFPGQEDWTWRKYYGIIGDLDRFPVYAYYGRNTIDFGWMDGYNPFTHTVNNHYFRGESDHPVIGLGFKKSGFHAIGSLVHSGRQIRVADSEDETGYSNGALNLSYQFGCDDRYLKVGGGYLHNSIYNNVIAHHPDHGSFFQAQAFESIRNPVYDIYAEVKYDCFRFGIEHTRTAEAWPVTRHEVAATNIQAAYDTCLLGKPTRLSAVYGVGKQGPDGTEYERLSQLVVGVETRIHPAVRLSAEWVHNEAFVPLIGITRPGIANADVEADAFLVGAKVQF